ncbi:MAG TPA: hypothetical protein VF800_12250 [Telluria sp.]|jgi:hypothetical protein
MKPTFLTIATSFVIIAAGASPSFAQDSAEPTPTATASTEAPVPVFRQGHTPTGPVRLVVLPDSRANELRIVNRTKVVGANMKDIALGVSLALVGVSTQINGSNKEQFYGDPITDASSRANLVSPLVLDLPLVLDQKMAALVENANGAATYRNPLLITPLGWHLVYHELMADKEHEDKYVLRFAAHFSKLPEGAADHFLRKAVRLEQGCQYVSEPRTLTAWKENDYAAIAIEKKTVNQMCMDALAPFLPKILAIDSTAKIKAAKLNCRAELKQCVAETSTSQDVKEAKNACKEEYNECVSDDVTPLVAATPIGACKITYSSCKVSVIEKARALNPEIKKPPKSEFLPCATDYRACVAATK